MRRPSLGDSENAAQAQCERPVCASTAASLRHPAPAWMHARTRQGWIYLRGSDTDPGRGVAAWAWEPGSRWLAHTRISGRMGLGMGAHAHGRHV
eukprot:5585069-Prymnesium_polylepis.1